VCVPCCTLLHCLLPKHCDPDSCTCVAVIP
jgi:hypothetical protein